MNITTFEILELLSKTPGRKDKELILHNNSNDEELKFLFETASHPYLIYGVKDFTLTKNLLKIAPFGNIKLLRQQLVENQISGNKAKDLIEKVLSCSEDLAIKWLEATFKKNIVCGVDIKTINKIWPKLIPVFDVGLCAVLQSSEEQTEEKMNFDVSLEEFTKILKNGVWAIEPKFDGLRCITIIDEKGNISFKSRNGKELFNLEHIEKELKGLKNVVLDGEIYARNWNGSISIAHTQTEHKDKEQIKYYIFDMLTIEEWLNKNSVDYLERKKRIDSLLYPASKFFHIIPVSTYVVPNIEQAKERYKIFLQEGFEGVVLKNIEAKYPFKRSKDWLKWKPTITEDIEITGYEEGEGRNKNRLGAFFCDFKGKQVKVGGGYNDKQRQEFWLRKEEMVGKTIEVRCQEVTKDGSLRFPVFICIREDK